MSVVKEIKEMYVDEETFARNLFPDIMRVKSPPFHRDIYRLLSRDSEKYVAVVLPRGHAKSTLSTTIIPLHRAINGLEKNIVIVSETEDQAKDHLENIKFQIEENPYIKKYYGSLRGRKWRDDKIIIEGGPFKTKCQIVAKGMEQKFRGINFHNQRPTLIILDDIESEDNTKHDESRNYLKRKLDAAILPAIDPLIGRVFLVNTIVHHDAYAAEIIEDNEIAPTTRGLCKNGRWHYVIYKAIENFGTKNEVALWPEWLPLKELHARRLELKKKGREYLFFQEYQNEPISSEERTFKKEHFKTRHNYYVKYENGFNWLVDRKTQKIHSSCFTFLGVDPAISDSRKADFFAMCILAVDPFGKRYVIRMDLDKIKSPTVQANKVINHIFNYHVRVLGIESVAYQAALATLILEKLKEAGRMIQVMEFKPRTAKDARLKDLEWPISSGRLIFPQNSNDLDTIGITINQFTNYPKSKKDDAMDAVYYAEKVAMSPPKVSVAQAEKIVKKQEDGGEEHNWKTL